MPNARCDILIVGGGTGGCAAALAATSLGYRVILTEETDWVGGQLTAQGVPPDEHPWIEQCGCTRTYRTYREGVRAFYRAHKGLNAESMANLRLNPGGGWVSALCHEPSVGHAVLKAMLGECEGLTILLDTIPIRARVNGDTVEAVEFLNQETGETFVIEAAFVLDATETGELLPMTGTEYKLGAESMSETAEPNAVHGMAQEDNIQGITWIYALAHDEGSHRVIDKPDQYEKWRTWKPDFWPGPLLGFDVLHAHTGEKRTLPLYGKDPSDWYALFPYRQIVEPSRFEDSSVHPATIVNWPQNDYFEASILDVDDPFVPTSRRVPGSSGPISTARLHDAKQLSLSLLYWLQTEAPRHDGGIGYPGLYITPDYLGTEDGFAKYPYIRESRRIVAEKMILEQEVAAYTNPGSDRAIPFPDSVGIGAYRLDLHPSTNGVNTIDTSTLPFQIPLGSLLPVRMRNLLPACKNLGVTHLTNGCYRLHPIEWNIGESAGYLAAFCLAKGYVPQSVRANSSRLKEFQGLLAQRGIELEWPRLRAL